MAYKSRVFIVLLCLCIYFPAHQVFGWTVSIDELSDTEKGDIDKLRRLVKNDLSQEYMNEDVYLLRWLIYKNFKVEQASQALKDNLKWRKKQSVDSILKEDWSLMEKEFPYDFDVKDKDGRPRKHIKIV